MPEELLYSPTLAEFVTLPDPVVAMSTENVALMVPLGANVWLPEAGWED